MKLSKRLGATENEKILRKQAGMRMPRAEDMLHAGELIQFSFIRIKLV